MGSGGKGEHGAGAHVEDDRGTPVGDVGPVGDRVDAPARAGQGGGQLLLHHGLQARVEVRDEGGAGLRRGRHPTGDAVPSTVHGHPLQAGAPAQDVVVLQLEARTAEPATPARSGSAARSSSPSAPTWPSAWAARTPPG